MAQLVDELACGETGQPRGGPLSPKEKDMGGTTGHVYRHMSLFVPLLPGTFVPTCPKHVPLSPYSWTIQT